MNKLLKVDDWEQHNEIKRFSIPYKIKSSCPECDNPAILDMSETDSLYYPSFEKETYEAICCESCEHEWKIWFKINFDVVISES